jgi:hypothetical protein
MIRLVQLMHAKHGRRVAVVEEPQLRVMPEASSVHELAIEAIRAGKSLDKLISSRGHGEPLDYSAVEQRKSDWSLLPPFDHPFEQSRCLITGTGLTHRPSVDARDAMHTGAAAVNDSVKMFQIGVEGGKPKRGQIGASPEWFYKGTGSILRTQNQALDVPNHAFDGGEESEIAGCYVIADDGTPVRVGLVQANEFSDHALEAQNYLYLAQSKLRHCAIGPELVVGVDLKGEIRGHAMIERSAKTIWAAPLASGETHMCHSLANLEHHHFKHAEHRRPGDVHIHFFGADRFSFKEQLKLEDGDVMVVAYQNFGRPLRNPIRIDRSKPAPVKVAAL